MSITGGSLLALAFLAFCGFLVAGFCIWKLCEAAERQQKALEKEQAFRMAEREGAFRREKFLIALILKADPRLADVISKMPAGSAEEPDFSLASLAGVGDVMLSRKPL